MKYPVLWAPAAAVLVGPIALTTLKLETDMLIITFIPVCAAAVAVATGVVVAVAIGVVVAVAGGVVVAVAIGVVVAVAGGVVVVAVVATADGVAVAVCGTLITWAVIELIIGPPATPGEAAQPAKPTNKAMMTAHTMINLLILSS